MFNIFVSYAQPELRWAEYLKQLLAFADVNVFVAEHDLPAGTSLSAEISAQIKQCDLFVLLWTENARASTYVNQELFVGKTEGRKLLPLLLQPGVQLPTMLGDVKYLDIAKNPEAQISWLSSYVEQEARSKTRSNAIAVGLIALLAFIALRDKG